MGFAILRFQKVRSRLELSGRSAHNRRTTKQELTHVDASRIGKNEVLGNAVEKFDELTKNVKMRKNGVVAVEAVMSFSPEAKEEINLETWSCDSIKWIEDRFGKDNVLEVSMHMDEKTPHLHVLFVPRIGKKWNWREINGGRQGMREMQDSYAQAVASHNLLRGTPKSGRHHVPPAIYREIQDLKNILDEAKKETKTKVMERQRGVLHYVKAFFGEDKYSQFLSYVKDQHLLRKKAKALENDIFNKKDKKDRKDKKDKKDNKDDKDGDPGDIE
jgi:Plasmid recombination enzyme